MLAMRHLRQLAFYIRDSSYQCQGCRRRRCASFQWKASKFNPDDWAALFVKAGAQYVIPTTKHHDGITLWDAPGTGTRNTVARGPKRDLVGAISEAVRKAGIKFGVYYSGGLDWSVDYYPPMTLGEHVRAFRPTDAA